MRPPQKARNESTAAPAALARKITLSPEVTPRSSRDTPKLKLPSSMRRPATLIADDP